MKAICSIGNGACKSLFLLSTINYLPIKQLSMMENKELLNYEAPVVEIVEVEVERGFQYSTPDIPSGGEY